MVEELLDVDDAHVAELDASAVGWVIYELGALPGYSRTAFNSKGREFAAGTKELDGTDRSRIRLERPGR